MPDEFDDDQIGDEGLEAAENPGGIYGSALWAEARAICERAHGLLGDQVAGGKGRAKTGRVTLEIPEGLLLIAQYLAAREDCGKTWDWMEQALAGQGADARRAQKAVQERLTKYLTDALEEELHWLATGGHRILKAEADRRADQPEPPDQAR